MGEIASGKNPAADKKVVREAQRAANSTADRVEAVANSFIERYVKRNVGASWARETERLLRVEVIPEIGSKRIGEVSRADIHKLLDEMVDRGSPINANRLLAVLRRMFNWCIERGLVERSPCDKLKAPSPEQARDRVLSNSELRVAWQAFERIGWPFGRIAQLLLLTGARRDEIAGARWSESILRKDLDDSERALKERRCARDTAQRRRDPDFQEPSADWGEGRRLRFHDDDAGARLGPVPCESARRQGDPRSHTRRRRACSLDASRSSPHRRQRYGRDGHRAPRCRGCAQP